MKFQNSRADKLEVKKLGKKEEKKKKWLAAEIAKHEGNAAKLEAFIVTTKRKLEQATASLIAESARVQSLKEVQEAMFRDKEPNQVPQKPDEKPNEEK